VSFWVKNINQKTSEPITYDLTKSFVESASATNPNGLWSYVEFNPTTQQSKLLTDLVLINDPGTVQDGHYQWTGDTDGVPTVGAFFMHPNDPRHNDGYTNAMASFTVPAAGTYTVNVTAARGNPFNCGDGVTVKLWHNYVPVAQGFLSQISGFMNNHSIVWMGVAAGWDTLAVSVDPGGAYDCDFTLVYIQIIANTRLGGPVVGAWNSASNGHISLGFAERLV
jgi:hypothetical protein